MVASVRLWCPQRYYFVVVSCGTVRERRGRGQQLGYGWATQEAHPKLLQDFSLCGDSLDRLRVAVSVSLWLVYAGLRLILHTLSCTFTSCCF